MALKIALCVVLFANLIVFFITEWFQRRNDKEQRALIEKLQQELQECNEDLQNAEARKTYLNTLQEDIDKSELVISTLENKINILEEILKGKEQDNKTAETQADYYNKRIVDLKNQFEVARNEVTQAAAAFRDQAFQNAAQNYCQDLEEIQQKFNKAAQDAQDTYTALEAEMVAAYTDKLTKIAELSQERNQQYIELCSKTKAAIEANKRAELEKEEKDFFRIQLSKEDIAEIEKIREIEPYLRDKSALNKVIWSVYYKKPTSDMIGRVIGSKRVTGIYKITNIQNGRCYVGQAVDASSRWTQHIKRGLGAEAATRNKLYPAMQEAGPENFTFEIIEECPEAALNRKEQEWQEYFGAKEFGYSER